ncbi:hypothetical protein Tco_1377740 [Tanacetum coccineum]
MYSFNLENIVLTGGLACLITKATVDESNKWYRSLLLQRIKLTKLQVQKKLIIVQSSYTSNIKNYVNTASTPINTARPNVSTARSVVNTARPDVGTARQEIGTVDPTTPLTTTTIFDDEEMTLVDTLVKIKDNKAKSVVFKDTEELVKPERLVLTLKPLPYIDPKDKGKGVLEEPEPAKKMTRSDFDAAQIARDAEIARKLKVDLQAEVERERQREEEASKASIAEMYDEVQAGIDADALFAAKLQQEEREEYTIKERAKYLAETIAAQIKFRAAQRSAEIRSRQPTKSQLRNLTMTYLKNMGGYKHSQLKAKSFEEIKIQVSNEGLQSIKLFMDYTKLPRALDKYVAEILKKFDFVSVKTASTPIETQKPLVKDEEASDVDVHLYRSMIGSLMYLTASRPDIMFAGCACSRFQVTPKTSHLRLLIESLGNPQQEVVNFLAGDLFLGNAKSKPSGYSTIKAEYVAAAKLLWSKNPVYHSKTKHIEIRHHFILDAYEKKLIQVLKIHTDDNVADLLTKAFDVSSSIHNALTSDPSPRPLPTTHIPDSIPEDSGGNHGGQSSSDRSLSGNEGDMTLQSVYDLFHKDPLFDELADDTLDYMDTENAQDVGRTRNVVYEEKESVEDAVNQELVLTSKKDSTDKEKDSSDRLDEGTVDQTEGRSATPTTATPTPTIFGDDETIAQVLLNMSQAKAVSKEKEKGVELKDIEETERPRPTSTKSLLTLKPLPKIDPKDKGKKKIEEEDKSDTESKRKMQEDWETEEERKRLAEEKATNAALIQEFDDIKARMEADRLLALRLQEEERESSSLWKREQNSFMIQLQLKEALNEKVKRIDESFTAVGSTEDERKIKEMNEGAKDLKQKRLKKKVAKETPKKEDTAKVPAKVDVTEQGTKKRKGGHMKMIARKRKRPQPDVDSNDEHRECLKIVTFESMWSYITRTYDGTVIHMLVERRYPLSKDLLQRMLDLGLELKEKVLLARDLIKILLSNRLDE